MKTIFIVLFYLFELSRPVIYFSQIPRPKAQDPGARYAIFLSFHPVKEHPAFLFGRLQIYTLLIIHVKLYFEKDPDPPIPPVDGQRSAEAGRTAVYRAVPP